MVKGGSESMSKSRTRSRHNYIQKGEEDVSDRGEEDFEESQIAIAEQIQHQSKINNNLERKLEEIKVNLQNQEEENRRLQSSGKKT